MTDDPTRPPADEASGTGFSEPVPPADVPGARDVPEAGPEEAWESPWGRPEVAGEPETLEVAEVAETAETPAWSTAAPGADPSAAGPPPPAWRDVTTPPPEPEAWTGWGEQVPPPAPRPPSPRRGLLTAAVAGALVGAVVAGVLVTVLRDDGAASGPTVTFSSNTSKIARPADIQGILAKVQPAVVSIQTRTLSLGDFLRPVPGEGAGTGFVISEDGVIVTNNHVVDRVQSIEVVFGNDRKMPARVLGRDPSTDLAVLKVDASGLPTATLGNSDELRVGDDVLAIGNALNLPGGPTVTLGIVSAKDRSIAAESGLQLEHVIQTDTAINPGNSGGPLVNSSGEVVGINTAVAGDAQNIGFSIAISEAKPIIDELRQGTNRTRPFLGVNMIDVTPAVADTLKEQLGIEVDKGALVLDVTQGSGAEVGGIRRHDVIVEIDGKAVEDASDVSGIVRGHKPGDELKITVLRRDGRETLDVRLGERPVDVG